MDELAHLVKMDPLQFRLKNLTDPRLRAVFEAAAVRFGWGRTKPARGHGFGIGGGVEKGGYIAVCAEVAMNKKNVRIVRVVAVFECGAVVNPDGLRNQVSGSIVQGIGGALFEAVPFVQKNKINLRFFPYPAPRVPDESPVDIRMFDRTALLT